MIVLQGYYPITMGNECAIGADPTLGELTTDKPAIVIGPQHRKLERTTPFGIRRGRAPNQPDAIDSLRSTALLARLREAPPLPEETQLPAAGEIKNLGELERELMLDLTFFDSLGLHPFLFREDPSLSQDGPLVHAEEHRHGVSYQGHALGSEPHGTGTMISATAKYTGNFKRGCRHGYGREIMAREVYEGEFDRNIRKGAGVRWTPDRTETGKFNRHFIEGDILWKNGDSYKGSMTDGKFVGEGCLFVKAAGATYRGRFENGACTGEKWVVEYSDGSKYEGPLKDRLRHTNDAQVATFTWPNGDQFIGGYYQGKKHGSGTLVQAGRTTPLRFEYGALVDIPGALETPTLNSQGLPPEWQ